MNPYLALLMGLFCAGLGGEAFIRGAVGMASWLRIAPGIIGATVAAFATSSPELSVSVNAALARTPEIALGDALGSNVTNIGLILALALLISPIQAPRETIKREFPIAVVLPLMIALLAIDGTLSQWDGMMMLTLFVAWLVSNVLASRRDRNATEEVLGERKGILTISLLLFGLVLLVVSGNLIVSGAKEIAGIFGMDPFVVGATIVAIGTSTPELATSVVAKLRGHDEVGLGTLLGSNIFNGLLIVSIAAVINPIRISWTEVFVGLLFGVLTIAVAFPPPDGTLRRSRGGILLFLYIVYMVLLLIGGPYDF